MIDSEKSNARIYRTLLALGNMLLNISELRESLHLKHPSFDGNETKQERMCDKDILHIISSYAVGIIKNVPVMKDYGKWTDSINNIRQEDIGDINILLDTVMNDDQRLINLSDVVDKKYHQYKRKFLNLKNNNQIKHSK